MTKETVEFLLTLLLKFQGTPADDKGWDECLKLRKAKEELQELSERIKDGSKDSSS